MDLESISQLFQIIDASGTAFLAIIVILINRRHEKQKIDHEMQNWWQSRNETVILDPHLLNIEAKLHPYEDLSAEDIKRMYLHFMTLNIALNSWSSKYLGDRYIINATILSCINITYMDRDFIIKNILTRGHPEDFVNEITFGYGKISRLYTLLKINRHLYHFFGPI